LKPISPHNLTRNGRRWIEEALELLHRMHGTKKCHLPGGWTTWYEITHWGAT